MNFSISESLRPVDLTKGVYARDKTGNIKLQCTRKFESHGLVLRIRTLRMTGSGALTERPILLMATCDRDTPKESWLRYMETMVDIVRLRYPGEGFTPHRANYHGPRPQ